MIFCSPKSYERVSLFLAPMVFFLVRPSSTFSKEFSSETTRQISIKFHMQPPGKRGKKAVFFGPGHMTKMTAMPMYGKNHTKIFFSRTAGSIA